MNSAPGSGILLTGDSFGKAFQICSPEAGTWTIIAANSGAVEVDVQTYAFSVQDGIEIAVSAPVSLPTFPEVAELKAVPTYRGERVVGAVVTGTAIRPDGSSIGLIFYDDGLEEHGDPIAGDRIYGTRFTRYNGNGTYIFEVKVVNFNGTTYAGGVALFVRSDEH